VEGRFLRQRPHNLALPGRLASPSVAADARWWRSVSGVSYPSAHVATVQRASGQHLAHVRQVACYGFLCQRDAIRQAATLR
jgi:hypothetical protein